MAGSRSRFDARADEFALGGLGDRDRLDRLLDRWLPATQAPPGDDDGGADQVFVRALAQGLIERPFWP